MNPPQAITTNTTSGIHSRAQNSDDPHPLHQFNYGCGAPRSMRARPIVTSKPCRGYQPLLDVAFAHDVVVAVLATTRQHAQRHAAACIDLILAQGTEAGGHTAEVATMVLVPEVADLDGPARSGRSGFADISAIVA